MRESIQAELVESPQVEADDRRPLFSSLTLPELLEICRLREEGFQDEGHPNATFEYVRNRITEAGAATINAPDGNRKWPLVSDEKQIFGW